MTLWLLPDAVWLPMLAFAMDMLLGDPSGWPHPVRWVGALLTRLQTPLLRVRRHCVVAGGLSLLAALLVTGTVIVLVLTVLPGVASGLIALYLAYSGLALGCLLREGSAALRAIAGNDIQAGRDAVSLLVSRDVSELDQNALLRTLAETISENFTDAFVGPWFWLLVGGPLGLWLYKTVSTADSMWGYRHEPWAERGRIAARADDVLAFVPARLSVLFLWLGGRLPIFLFGESRAALRPLPFTRLCQQARRMESPNAGWSMAAAALLHGARMGGPAVYAGKKKDKPLLGPDEGEWSVEGLRNLLRHVAVSGVVACIALWLVACAVTWCFI